MQTFRKILRWAGLLAFNLPICLQGLKKVLELIGFSTAPEDTMGLLDKLSSLPLWVTILCALGAWAMFLLWPWLEQRRQETEPTKPEARSPWESEFHDHRQDRREFWRLMEMAYGYWPMNPDKARSLRDVVARAAFPIALPLADNSTFPDWAWSSGTEWTCDTKQLGQFLTDVYIPCKPPMAVKSQLMGSGLEFDRFDAIRMELAKFWDHWGRQEPLEKIIREQNADSIVKANASEIKLLTFLEIARVRWADSDTPGKSGLFRLGCRNSETGV